MTHSSNTLPRAADKSSLTEGGVWYCDYILLLHVYFESCSWQKLLERDPE